MAAGADYPILSSEDGENWGLLGLLPQLDPLGGNISITSMTSAEGHYRAFDSEFQEFESTDGVHWNPKGITSQGLTFAFAYAKGVLARATAKGIYVSTNGGRWFATGVPYTLSVASDGDQIIGLTIDRKLFVSNDSAHWIDHTPQDANWKQVAWVSRVGDLWIGYGGQEVVFTSSNGVDWTLRHGPTVGGQNFVKNTAMQMNHTYWIRSSAIWWSSIDGVDWIKGPVGIKAPATAVVTDGQKAVAYGTGGYLAVSEDLISWRPIQKSLAIANPEILAYANGVTFSIGPDHLTYSYSSNHVDWFQGKFPGTKGISDVAYGNGTFAAVGDGGTVLLSKDLVTWSPAVTKTDSALLKISVHEGVFAVAGNNGTVVHSVDGLKWESTVVIPKAISFLAVAWFKGSFYFTSYRGDVISTSDFIQWNIPSPPLSAISLDFLAASSDRLVAVRMGSAFSSTDGVHWQSASIPFLGVGAGVSYANGYFVILTQTGTIRYSQDGLNYTRLKFTQTGGRSLIFAHGRFWMSTTDYSLLASDPLITLEQVDPITKTALLYGDIGSQYTLESSDGFDADSTWTPADTVLLESNPQVIPLSPSVVPGKRFLRARLDP